MRRQPVQNDAQWKELRRGVISSTEVAALFGIMLDRHSPYELSATKRGKIDPVDLDGNERVELGMYLETGIKAAIRARMPEWEFDDWNSLAGRPRYFAFHDRVRMGCSLDAIATHKQTREQRIVEVKNVDYLVFRDQWMDPDGGAVEPPPHIHIQGQAQSAVTGIPVIQYVPLVGGNQLWAGQVDGRSRDILVHREQDVVAEIERRVTAFWAAFDAGREPDIDGYDATGRAIRELYATAGQYEKPVELSDVELATWCFERDQLGARIKQLEIQRDAYTNQIKAKLGEISKAVCNGWRLSFGLVKGSTFTVTREPGRQLRVTAPKAAAPAAAAAE